MLFYLSLSLFSLLLAGFFGLLIALTRTPAVSLLKSPELFYHFLVGHVTFSITLWLMSFTLAYWHYKEGRKGRVAPPATLLGMLLLSLSCLLPYGEPYLNNYIPVIAHPLFYAGLSIFFFGFFVEALLRLSSLRGLKEGTLSKQLYALSLLLGLLTVLSLLPSFFIAHQEGGMKLYFERLFWIPGHLQQFMYTSVMLAVWHELLKRSSGISLESSLLKVSNLLLLYTSLLLLTGFFFGDPLSDRFRLVVVFSFGVGMGVPLLVHSLYILKSLKKGFSVATLSLLLSMGIYHLGAFIAYGGMRSDLRIPAHYHGVVSGVSIAFMGFTYYLLKEKLGHVVWDRLAKWQAPLFGLGINLLVFGFYLAGRMGAPRKTYGFEYAGDVMVLFALNMVGLGGVLAVIGGLLFLAYAGATLWRSYGNGRTF
jgi:heme/copper-type cytochrome/quinol oxidase subunit 1